MSDLITIKIKSPTASIPHDLSFPCTANSTIQHLKSRIQDKLVEGGRNQTVVLIYRGKILADEETVGKTVAGEEVVVFHAIFRAKDGAAEVGFREEKKEEVEEEAPPPPYVEVPIFERTIEPPVQNVPTSTDIDQTNPFTTLPNTTTTLSALTFTTPTHSFRLSPHRTPQGGFLLVGPTGASAILYPSTPAASAAAPSTSIPEYTFRMSGPFPPTDPAPALAPAQRALPDQQQQENIAAAAARVAERRDRTNDLWLALKLGALLWLLTDRRDVRRTVGMWVAAIAIFVTQTGLLRSLLRSLTTIYTDLFPPLHPPAPGAPVPTAGPAITAPALPPHANGVQGLYRNIERVVGLFIASLVPDVGERRARVFEEAGRQRPAQVPVQAPVVEEAREVREGGEVLEGEQMEGRAEVVVE